MHDIYFDLQSNLKYIYQRNQTDLYETIKTFNYDNLFMVDMEYIEIMLIFDPYLPIYILDYISISYMPNIIKYASIIPINYYDREINGKYEFNYVIKQHNFTSFKQYSALNISWNPILSSRIRKELTFNRMNLYLYYDKNKIFNDTGIYLFNFSINCLENESNNSNVVKIYGSVILGI